MKIGGGGLESMATHELVSNIKKADRSEPNNNRKNDAKINEATNPVDGNQSKVNSEDLIKAVNNVNKAFETFNQGLHFKVNDETNQLVVQIVDQKTDEVIKQIPSQEVLDLEAQLREMVGVFLDEKA